MSQRLTDLWDKIRWFYDDHIHFLQLHYLYITFIILVSSALFYTQPNTEWPYIDALFMATSSVTNTGLNTIVISTLSVWQLMVMCLSSVAGSHIMISIIILLVRRRAFYIRFKDVLNQKASPAPSEKSIVSLESTLCPPTRHTIAFAENVERQRELARQRLERSREPTREQRYRLGGAEYRAIRFLTGLVPVYYCFFTIGFGFLIRLSTIGLGLDRPWLFSFVCSLSSFNNLGLLPMDDSMVPFQSAPGLLLAVMVLILAGNTAYAIFLRVVIWALYRLTPESAVRRRETLRYLLDHPRRCYTTLFPSTQTKWLLFVLIAITAVEFVAFLALNYWLPVLKGIGWGQRVLTSLFQAVATRSAGYSIVDLMYINPGTQIVFIVAMYISVYPVAISMRNSNVYQERALGIYKGQQEDDHDYHVTPFIRMKRQTTLTSIMTTSKKVLMKPDFFVMTQIQRQLTSEICWVICCIFAICVIEAESIMSVSPITIASIIYECISAFGNVGGSTGYPNTSTSQAQQYHPLSKLVLILLMFRGRHRGLPAAIDRAVLLPSEQLEQQEEEDDLLRQRNASISGEIGSCPIMFYSRSRTL